MIMPKWMFATARDHAKTKENARNKKAGRGDEPVAEVQASAEEKSRASWLLEQMRERHVMAKNIVLIIAGIILFRFWLYTPGLPISGLGVWVYDHWVTLGLFIAFILTLVRMNKAALGEVGESLQTATLWATFILFVGFPTLDWIGIGQSNGSQKTAANTMTMPANGDSKRMLPPAGYRLDFIGTGFTLKCLYKDGTMGVSGDPKDTSHPCKDGPLEALWVHDTTGKTNVAEYKISRM